MAEPARFSGRPSTPGARSAIVVACVVVALLALAIAKPWDRSPLPSPSGLAGATPVVTPPASSTAPTSSATPTPAPLVPITAFTLDLPPPGGAPWTVIRWQRLEPGSPIQHLGTAVHWTGGYASLGDDGQGGTVLWSSRNGIGWAVVASGTADTFWPGQRLLAIAPLGRRLVAVTTLSALTSSTPEPSDMMAWASDDGTAWAPIGGPTFPAPLGLTGTPLLAGTGGQVVLAWNEAPTAGAAGLARVAVTADGVAWRRLPASALPAGFEASDLVATPSGGFALAGRTVRAGAASAAILRSNSTGTAWAPIALPQDEAQAAGERVNVVWSIVRGISGLLAIGDSPGRELWWRSSDGRHWTAVPGFGPISAFDPLGPSGCPESLPNCGAYPDGFVVGDGERLVAVGGASGSSALGVWTSSDASRWQRLDQPGARPTRPASEVQLLPGGVVLSDGDAAWYGAAASEP